VIGLQDISDVMTQVTSEISARYPHLLSAYPPSRYIDYLDAYPKTTYLKYLSSDVEDYCRHIRRDSDEATLDLYHRLLLAKLVVRARETLKTSDLPEDIISLYHENYERIVRDIQLERYPRGFYLHPTFCKELALCTCRLIPAGAAKIHLDGLCRRYLLRRSANQRLRFLCLLLNLRGFKPLYHIHLDSRDRKAMRQFNHQGWVEFLRRVAVLLRIHPSVKGICGESWFFDPQVAHITPKLAFLTKLVTDGGGSLFPQGPCDHKAIRRATFMAPDRQRLYQQGKYVPTQYLAVWPRRQLLAWATANTTAQPGVPNLEPVVKLSES